MSPQTDSRFVDAVFNIDVESFRMLLEKEIFNYGLLIHVFPDSSDSVPLNFIPLFWECVLRNLVRQYEPDEKEVRIQLWRNRWLMQIMADKLGADFPPLNFKTPRRLFKGTTRNQMYKKLFNGTSRELHDNRHWEADLDLYCAVDRLNLRNAESLLRKGADPWYDTPGMHDNCFNIVDFESSPLISRLSGIIFKCSHVDATARNVDVLERLAQFYKMRELLQRYGKMTPE